MFGKRKNTPGLEKHSLTLIVLEEGQDRPCLTLSGPRFFWYRKDRAGGGMDSTPFDFSENWYVEYAYIVPLNCVENMFTYEGPFSKMSKPNLHF